MPKRNVDLTEAEWVIIKEVWAREPCTATTIRGEVRPMTHWSYSTVRTIMDRMVGKGLLTAEKKGKVTLFRSAVTREQAQQGELLYALKHAFDGAFRPMVQCLIDTGRLSDNDLAELESLINTRKRQRKE